MGAADRGARAYATRRAMGTGEIQRVEVAGTSGSRLVGSRMTAKATDVRQGGLIKIGARDRADLVEK
jgi:hypothetical protein